MLDTEGERRRTQRNRNDEERTTPARGERVPQRQSGDERFGRGKERNVKNDASNRKCRAGTHCKNDEGVLGVVTILGGVIPLVEHFHDGTDQANQEYERGGGG